VLTDPNLNAPTVPGPGVQQPLAEADPEVAAATTAELRGQQPTVEMTAGCERVDVRWSAALCDHNDSCNRRGRRP
jgi:hypothetical protein